MYIIFYVSLLLLRIALVKFYIVVHIWLSSKESACSAGGVGLIPGSGRSLGEVSGNPLRYSSLGNPMDTGPRWAL